MNFFATNDDTKLFYKDIGDGPPVILIHGWPLSSDMWDEQVMALVESGFRVVAYDRRGFGRSEQPATGYDYNTFASDLNDLINFLGFDKVSLIGFSMGGGEIARYLGRYGSEKVSCVGLVSAITPMVRQTQDNPEGVPEEKLREIERGIRKDRFAFFEGFFKDFYGVNLMNHPVSTRALNWAEMVASQAALHSTISCVNAFGRTDFRPDMKSFVVPTLIIHGTSDKTVPIETSAEQAARMIQDVQLKRYEGAPHGLNLTHKDELNQDLVGFLRQHTVDVLGSKSSRNKMTKPQTQPYREIH